MIAKQSKKQSRLITKYLKQRKIYFLKHENQLCKIELVGCTRRATEVHHSAKKRTEEDWLNESEWIPCCNHCHRQVEDSPELAKQLGIYNYKA